MAFQRAQSGVVSGGFYNAFRENGAPTYYGPNTTSFQSDLLESGLIFASCILAFSLYLMLPGYPGKSKFFNFLWITVGIYVGAVILIVQFSDEWESSETEATTKYKAGTGAEINATIGLHIGLRGVNITLKGNPVHQLNETINYNEHFDFSTRQGRLGFGPFANTFNQEFRAAQARGLPLPILWVAEYFTLDGEALRWGRFYREAGLYASICLWIAFGLWVLANILVFILLRYAAYTAVLTSIFMGISMVVKHYLRTPNELVIPFSAEHKLQPQYGIAFWFCLSTACICVVCGLAIFLMDLRWPHIIAYFFNADVLQEEKLFPKEDSTVSTASTDTIITTSSNGDTELIEVVVDPRTDSPTDSRIVIPKGRAKRSLLFSGKVTPTGSLANYSGTISPKGSGTVTPSGITFKSQNVGQSPYLGPQSKNNKCDTIDKTYALDSDWTGESQDWEDWSSDSDHPNTDDEYKDEPPMNQKSKVITQRHGFISRFQRPRRVPGKRFPANNLTAKKPALAWKI